MTARHTRSRTRLGVPSCRAGRQTESRLHTFCGPMGGSDVRVAPADGTGTSRGVTLGAQAFKVRWLWSRNVLLVLGFWGNHLPGVRLVTPTGGETSVINIPAAVAPDSDGPDFDSSLDGTLLAFTQSTRQTELWVWRPTRAHSELGVKDAYVSVPLHRGEGEGNAKMTGGWDRRSEAQGHARWIVGVVERTGRPRRKNEEDN